ncbi:hypothetical protein ANN_09275 [Periplaneta americana]|uniref:Uncharacterized protein n=1 Tax=Periplaneta americana TaxID=6978 RepID=A0ABQ8TMY7_PERAM|nr:hypothetical protein ANN_09275 [Periplaneta americana]
MVIDESLRCHSTPVNYGRGTNAFLMLLLLSLRVLHHCTTDYMVKNAHTSNANDTEVICLEMSWPVPVDTSVPGISNAVLDFPNLGVLTVANLHFVAEDHLNTLYITLNNLHRKFNIYDEITNNRRLRWAGHVARMGESRNAYRVLVGTPEGKRPLGRPRRGWEDNIKMDLREVGYDDRDWINLAQDRDRWGAYVRAAMNLRFARKHVHKEENWWDDVILAGENKFNVFGSNEQQYVWRKKNEDLEKKKNLLPTVKHGGTTHGMELYGCRYSASSYDERVMERRKIPAPERIFLRSITLSSYDDAEYLHGNIICTSNLVVPPLVAITAATPLGMFSTSLCRISTGMRRHSSCNMALSWTMEGGRISRNFNRRSNSSQRCSMGLRSGLCAGQSNR